MVGVGIAGVYILVGQALDIVGDNESVQCHSISNTRNIFHICITGAVPKGCLLLFGQQIQTEGKMFWKLTSGKRKCPGLTALRILFGSLQVVVKVAAAEHIIAGFVFFCHIIAQHLNLSLADGIAVAVSGHMQIEDHQLLAIVHRDPGDAVAAVQIEELAEGSGDGEASAQSRRLENSPSPALLLPWGCVNG